MKSILSKLVGLFTKTVSVGSLQTSIGAVTATAIISVSVVGGTAWGLSEVFSASSDKGTVVESMEEQNAELKDDISSMESKEQEEATLGSEGDQTPNDAQTVEEFIANEKNEAHVHSYVENILQESTCVTKGLAEYVCSECGESYERALPLSAHIAGEWVTILEPTRTSDGLRSRICVDCGIVLENETLPVIPCTHNYQKTTISSPTCEANGENYYECTNCGSYYTEVVPATGHSYKFDHIDEATCEKEGAIYSKCENCGDTIKAGTIAKKEHTYGDWETVTEATCTEAGEETRECSACGYVEPKVIPATGHTESNVVTTQEADCTHDGEYTYTCSVCGAVVENNVIPALGHVYGDPVVTDSTCSEEGNKKYTCQRDNCDYYYEEVIEKKDHTESDWITDNAEIDSAPTCTEDGLKHTECTVCHAIMQRETIPATGHSYGEPVVVDATCITEGSSTITCTTCDHSETTTIPMIDHTYEVIIDTPATCEQNGAKHEECSYCHDSKNSETIPATGHKFVHYEVVTEATDLEAGLERATCENDGCSSTDERVIPKLPHTHDYNVRVDEKCVAVTCETDGKEVFKCRCGDELTNVIPKTGHNYERTQYTAPSCEMDGAETYTCTNDGCTSTYTNTLVKTGHTAGEWVVTKEATDLEEGHKELRCSVCSALMDEAVISKLPHTCEFTEETERQDATCTTDGFVIRKCRCNNTDKEILPKTNHPNTTWVTSKDASYTETGLKEEVCDDCHAVVNTEVLPVIPHECNYEVVSETPATCTEAGSKTSKCTLCGATTTITMNAKGHSESGWIVDKNPTCLEEGKRHTQCTVCGISLTTETLPATGHTEGGWTVDKEASCTENGSKHTECSVCHATMTTETIPATGHSMSGWSTTTPATCTSDGTETNSCGRCSYSESRSIPALGHAYGDWIVDKEPTEEEEGSQHKECSRCGDRITEDIDVLPPHVHSYELTSTTDSTCTQTGSNVYTCSGCGNSYSEEIPMKPHTPGDWTVKTPATEEATGLEVRNCTVCGTQTDSRVLEKLEHVHNYTTEHKDATCTEDGYDKQTCRCGSVINTVLPATGHSYGEPVVVDATCTANGSSTITCTKCNHSETTTIPMIDHVYVETERIPATCGQEGSVTYECSGCGAEKSDTLEALTHNYTLTSTIEATCTADGYTIETCSNCGDTKQTTTDTALGHDYSKEVVTKEAELGVDGEKEIQCSRCGDVGETQTIPMLLTDGTDSVYTINLAGGETTIVIGHYEDEMATRMTQLVDDYRAENGLDPLPLVGGTGFMESYTATRAYQIAHTFDHKQPDGTGLYSGYGENIATGATSRSGNDPVTAFFEAWKASPGHNSNMLGGYNYGCVKMFAERLIDPNGVPYYKYHCVQTFKR